MKINTFKKEIDERIQKVEIRLTALAKEQEGLKREIDALYTLREQYHNQSAYYDAIDEEANITRALTQGNRKKKTAEKKTTTQKKKRSGKHSQSQAARTREAISIFNIGESFTTKDVKELVGETKGNGVSTVLWKMMKDGLIERVGTSTYQRVDKSEAQKVETKQEEVEAPKVETKPAPSMESVSIDEIMTEDDELQEAMERLEAAKDDVGVSSPLFLSTI